MFLIEVWCFFDAGFVCNTIKFWCHFLSQSRAHTRFPAISTLSASDGLQFSGSIKSSKWPKKKKLFATVSSTVASKISQPMHPPACQKNPPASRVWAQYQLHAFFLNSGWSIISSPYRSIRDSKGPKRH